MARRPPRHGLTESWKEEINSGVLALKSHLDARNSLRENKKFDCCRYGEGVDFMTTELLGESQSKAAKKTMVIDCGSFSPGLKTLVNL